MISAVDREYAQQMARAVAERLEQQAALFILFGYSPSELVTVYPPDFGPPFVSILRLIDDLKNDRTNPTPELPAPPETDDQP